MNFLRRPCSLRDATRALVRVLAPLMLLVFVTGCMQTEAKPAELLRQSMHRFHGDLRWKRFDEAAGHVTQEQREDFLSYYQRQRGRLFITEYEFTQIKVSKDETEAEVKVLITWYQMPSTRVQTSVMEEEWVFIEKTRHWEITQQDVKPVDGVASKTFSDPPVLP